MSVIGPNGSAAIGPAAATSAGSATGSSRGTEFGSRLDASLGTGRSHHAPHRFQAPGETGAGSRFAGAAAGGATAGGAEAAGATGSLAQMASSLFGNLFGALGAETASRTGAHAAYRQAT